MQAILGDIGALMGVTGSFVCGRDGALFGRAMPALTEDGSLATIGRSLMQTFAGLETARRRKVGDIDMVFGEGRLIVKPFGGGCVGIVCVPRINVALVNLTANVAVRKIHEELKERAAPPARAPRDGPRPGRG